MKPVYDRIGDSYDTTRKADREISATLARLIGLRSDGQYLDIGCGSGNYTVALAGAGGAWTGVEPSIRMLDLARQKPANVTWVQAPAEELPFPDQSFDGAIATLCIHHFSDLAVAFQQAGRVLKPGFRLILFTVLPEQVLAFWLKRYFPEMLARDAEQLPSLSQIEDALVGTGLSIVETEPYFTTERTEDFFFFSGKYRPEIYLSENIRNSMSCFRISITDEELARGLTELERDIGTGAITRIIADGENDLGDHSFIVLQKVD